MGFSSLYKKLVINIALCVACGIIMFGTIIFAQEALAAGPNGQDPFERMMPFYVASTLLMLVWGCGITYITIRERRAERRAQRLMAEHAQLVREHRIHDKTTETILATYKQLTYIDLVNDEMLVVYASAKPEFQRCAYSEAFAYYQSHGALLQEDVKAFNETLSLEGLRQGLAENDVMELKFRMNHPNGLSETYIATAAVIDRVDGVPVSAAFSMRSVHDVLSKDREHRDALMAIAEQAEVASKAKGEFLSRMSHDMRTPLNAIKGMTAIAHINADDPQRVQESLAKIDASSDHLLAIIDEVLDMSKIESGRMVLAEEPIDLRELVASVKALLEPQAAEKGIALRFSCGDVRHFQVEGDASRLREMLVNIAGNSVKFTEPGGTVSLKVSELSHESRGKSAFAFTVADNGIGMDKEFLERIFEPFSRSDQALQRNIEGTGLGTTIALNIARLMGGDITVDSEPGAGSCFKMNVFLGVLPEAAEERCADTQESGEIEGSREDGGASGGLKAAEELAACDYTGKRALVVDDVDINAEIACELLAAAGMESEAVADGAQAVERILGAEPGTFDIVFMDIQMPVMDGYEATRAVRAAASDNRPDLAWLPIIAMTANAFAEDARAAREADMDGHIPKPVNLRTLQSVLANWVR